MTRRHTSINSVNLSFVEQWPSVETPTAHLFLLHGFTGSAAGWAAHVDAFVAAGIHVVAIDMLGHGLSDAPSDPDRYHIERCRDDLVALAASLDLQPGTVDLLGYSMGGRIALFTALSGFFRRLILESASPGIADSTERLARRVADEQLADSIERDGIAAFVARWEALPLFASQRTLPDAVQSRVRYERLRNTPHGLANSLRGVGTGTQPALHDQLVALTIPTLLIAGALDAKYVASAQQMAAALPHAQVAIVPDAGHTVHLERPAIFDTLVTNFVQRT